MGLDIETYLERRRQREEAQRTFRPICRKCLQPGFACYCARVQPFDPGIQFAILTHHIEAKRRIATGRMAHLCLQDSLLIQGEDYSQDPAVNRLMSDPKNHCMILYPKGNSINVSHLPAASLQELFPLDKNLVLFVIDGTWNTARKTMYRSKNLRALPRICFTPPKPSQFRIRVQPDAFCYSTLEAIHHTIELIGGVRGFDTASGRHDHLLEHFNRMIEQQLLLKDLAHKNPLVVTGRRKRKRRPKNGLG
ncbi:MAG: DTW domain-containing protein [Bdellovibrionales bacterium]|nr:DTW domain-containing protein [Bdellovibrionales bacterium]